MTTPSESTTANHGLHKFSTTTLVIAAMGVVFGDIGTSPIYAMKECFSPASSHSIAVNSEHVLGVVSLVLWSLIALICIKYLVFVLRADNKGEGGVLSLVALATHGLAQNSRRRWVLLSLGIFGGALLYGDGMITPSISVLSAVEGLKDANIFGAMPTDVAEAVAWTRRTENITVLLTVLILVGLFSVQFMGTARMGRYFGPVTLLWFVALAVLGIYNLCRNAEGTAILAAFNPLLGLKFLFTGGMKAFVILGSVFLVVTGGESLYADMGHFGARPIRRGWFFIAFPALMLNYLGQGALLLRDPSAATAPFFQMAPGWATLPVVFLATAATVIASQALITGTFSITLTAVQLGYLPRISVRHTSEHARGQIYIPLVNWMLMLACVALVCSFRSSTNLAAAYGVAVSMTMLITSLMFYFVARYQWKWPLWKALPLCAMFVIIESLFTGSNLLKFFHGGWLPVVISVMLFILMSTWNKGRRLVRERLEAGSLSQEMLIDSLTRRMPIKVPGTAVFLSGSRGRTPVALLHNLKHNGTIHDRVVFLTIIVEDEPWVPPGRRVEVEDLGNSFWRVTGHYGFMQKPHVPRLLRACSNSGLEVSADKATFFLGREIIVPSKKPGMARWREHIFSITGKLAQQPATFFQIPLGRVIELGQQVEI